MNRPALSHDSRDDARTRCALALAAGAVLVVLAACESVPLGPDPASAATGGGASARATAGASGVVADAPPVRPAPEAIETVQETVSPACLDLGRPDDAAKPDYPAAAAKVRQEGWVRFRFDVEDGRVVRPEVMQSSPAGLFDDAVLAWARSIAFPSGRSATGCVMEYEYRLEPVLPATPAAPTQ